MNHLFLYLALYPSYELYCLFNKFNPWEAERWLLFCFCFFVLQVFQISTNTGSEPILLVLLTYIVSLMSVELFKQNLTHNLY